MFFDFGAGPVKQGRFQSGKLRLDTESFQLIQNQKLTGETIGETIYLQSIKPFLKNQTNNFYETDVVVVFLKIPNDKIVFKVSSAEIPVSWSKVEFIPTEAEKDLIWGSFNLPQKFKSFLWPLIPIILVLGLVYLRIRKKWKIKKIVKKKNRKLKHDLISPATYEEIVKVWTRKQEFVETFPHIASSFKDLEIILFKYQFRKFQSEDEKKEVIESYKEFVKKIEGGFNGI